MSWNSPYITDADFSPFNGNNVISGNPITITGATTDGAKITFENSTDEIVSDAITGTATNNYTVAGFWIKPSQAWVDDLGMLSVYAPSESYLTSYAFLRFAVQSVTTVRCSIYCNNGANVSAKTVDFSINDLLIDDWNYVTFLGSPLVSGNGDVNFNGATPTITSVFNATQSRNGNQFRIRNHTDSKVEFLCAFWDDSTNQYYGASGVETLWPLTPPTEATPINNDLYNYQYVKFTSSEPLSYTGAYTANADYDILNGSNEGSNPATPSSVGVSYDGRYFTGGSIDTGLDFYDIWSTNGSRRNFSFKIKLTEYPSSEHTLLKFSGTNLGRVFISSTGVLKHTLIFTSNQVDVGQLPLNEWISVGVDVFKDAGDYGMMVWFCNQDTTQIGSDVGNARWQAVGASTVTNHGWDLNIYPIGEIFNVISSDFIYGAIKSDGTFERIINKNGKWDAYAGAIVSESGGITFPDGSKDSEFILSTQADDLGYGSSGRTIFNKNVEIKDIRYQIGNGGLQNIQNCRINFDNVDSFYHQMRELNGSDFWVGLKADVYWASGRVPSLVYDGADWKKDGETVVSFTPSTSYPLTDSIKKEFSGFIESASMNTKKTSLSLVSQEKQDSFYVGTIQSGNGADGARAKISPIVVGDMTDDEAYVPLVLKDLITQAPRGIASDIDLLTAPTPYIYDDENENFHEVVNNQTATDNNKVIQFYDSASTESVTTDSEYIDVDKFGLTAPKFYTLPTGETVSFFSDSEDFILFSDYDYPQDYHITSTAFRLRSEGSRDFNEDGVYSTASATQNAFEVDDKMSVGIAKVRLSLYPIELKTTTSAFTDDNVVNTGINAYFFENDAGGSNDFDPTEKINPTYNETSVFIGPYKNVIRYRGTTSQYPHTAPVYLDASDSLWVAPHNGGFNSGGDKQLLSTDWVNYNYYNSTNFGLTADFTPFKFDSLVDACQVYFYGGVYKDGSGASSDPDAFTLNDNSGVSKVGIGGAPAGATFVNYTLHNANDATSADYNLNLSQSVSTYANLDEFYENPPKISFLGYSHYNPVKTTGDPLLAPIASECYLDRNDPSYYRSTRFAIDGFRCDVDVTARVESKYWCFKGKTGNAVSLQTGLNVLAQKYTNASITARDTARANFAIAGVHIGEPIYYRDLLSKIANEFKVIITDNNGTSEMVSKGQAGVDWTFDESNVFAPFGDNITYGETPSTEIYNKIVVRYAKNHMTDRYGKTLEITKDSSTFTTNIVKDSNYDSTVTAIQSRLLNADDFLSKINVTEKVLTIDLDWVRDDNTAIALAYWNARNYSQQRSKVTINVGKRYFLNGKLGDGVRLDLPQLPLFYQSVMQVTKIVNKSNKAFTVELEEFL